MNILPFILLLACLCAGGCGYAGIRLHQGDIQHDLADANRDYRAGKYDKAEEAYAKLAAAYPSLAEAQYGLGSVALVRGDTAAGEQRLLKAASLNSARYEPHLVLGTLYLKAGRYEEAEYHLRTASELSGGNPEVTKKYEPVRKMLSASTKTDSLEGVRRGSELFRSGRLDDAERLFLRIRQARPSDVGAALWLGRIALKRGNMPGAQEWWRAALTVSRLKLLLGAYGIDAPDHLAETEAAIGRYAAGTLGALYLGALYLHNSEDTEKAYLRLREGRSALPELEYDVLIALATTAYRLQRYDEALARYAAAVRLKKDPLPYREMGRIYLWKKGLPHRAREAFEASLHLAPDDPAVRRELELLGKRTAR